MALIRFEVIAFCPFIPSIDKQIGGVFVEFLAWLVYWRPTVEKELVTIR
jgi:hypothetical protein